MKFVVLEQKYLEHLEAGRVLDALHVLRNELTPLQYDTPRVHRLSALMMCADAGELQARAHWPGGGAASRAAVLARVQAVLPPALMMAPGRLRALLAQAAQQQAARCRFHAAPRPAPAPDHIPFTLLADHHCSPDAFPIHSLQVLPHPPRLHCALKTFRPPREKAAPRECTCASLHLQWASLGEVCTVRGDLVWRKKEIFCIVVRSETFRPPTFLYFIRILHTDIV